MAEPAPFGLSDALREVRSAIHPYIERGWYGTSVVGTRGGNFEIRVTVDQDILMMVRKEIPETVLGIKVNVVRGEQPTLDRSETMFERKSHQLAPGS